MDAAVAAQHNTAAFSNRWRDHTPGLADGAGDDTAAGAARRGLVFSDGRARWLFLRRSEGSSAGGGGAAGSNAAPTVPPAAASHTAAPAASHAAPPVNCTVRGRAGRDGALLLPAPARAAVGNQPDCISGRAIGKQAASSNSLYFGGNLLQSAADTAAPQPSDFSSNPVQYATGIVALSFTDLPADNSGLPTGLTRSWTNGPSYSTGNYGSGMVFTQMPHLVQLSGGSIEAVANRHHPDSVLRPQRLRRLHRTLL